MSLNKVATQQDKATMHTKMLIKHMFSYCTIYLNTTLTYNASDMLLHIHTDVLYLSELGAKGYAGGFSFLTSKTQNI